MTSKILFISTLLFSHLLWAADIDWASAAGRDVTFFNAGTASWENVLTKDVHDGAKGLRKRKACVSCHAGEEAEMGEDITSDPDNQFHTPTSKSSVVGTLQMAIVDGSLHLRVALPGVERGQLSLLLDDGAFESSTLTGCWGSCHADAKGMPEAGGKEMTKYLSRSRSKNTKTGGGENYLPQGELDKLLGDGQFLELLSVKFSAESAQGLRGHVLEKRYLEVSDTVSASASVEAGSSSVTLSRPVAASGAGQKSISAGGAYSMGLSLHINDDKGSHHLVSLPLNFKVGAGDEIEIIVDEKDEE